jgi:2-polyprenyl-6-hydroxyphenyl methylase/3-demethylubiquinone-9 3-methyltransferase
MTDPHASVASAPVAPPSNAFRFGRNWQRYVASHLDTEREQIAAQSLRDLLECDLRGKSFLDIGSGSGLFSLCAFKAGASQVTSIDVDPDAVAATRHLRASVGNPDNWIVRHDSILSDEFVESAAPADVVYSWGVLHHTGQMDAAISNAARLVDPDGLFCIAIYNRVTGRFLDSDRWLQIKRRYNHSRRGAQVAMEWLYAAYWGATRLHARQNPFRVAKEYKASRGMALTTDLVDWLGGYPYEYATADEIVEFCESRCGLSLVKLVPTSPNGSGNNQFVFRGRSAG